MPYDNECFDSSDGLGIAIFPDQWSSGEYGELDFSAGSSKPSTNGDLHYVWLSYRFERAEPGSTELIGKITDTFLSVGYPFILVGFRDSSKYFQVAVTFTTPVEPVGDYILHIYPYCRGLLPVSACMDRDLFNDTVGYIRSNFQVLEEVGVY